MDMYNICEVCGKKCGIPHHICVECRSEDDFDYQEEDIVDQFKEVAAVQVKETKAIAESQGYGKKNAISDEESERRGREIDPIFAVMESPYLSASNYKWHDTRYRDRDPYAYTSAETMIKSYSFPTLADYDIFDDALLDFGKEQVRRMMSGEFDRKMNDDPRQYNTADINASISHYECVAINNQFDIEASKYDSIYLVQLLHELYSDEGIPSRLKHQLAAEEESVQLAKEGVVVPTPIMDKITEFANKNLNSEVARILTTDNNITQQELRDYLSFNVTYKTFIKDAIKKNEANENKLTEGLKDMLAISVKTHIVDRLFPTSKGDTQRHKCPICAKEGINVSADEFGCCPYGHGRIYNNARASKGIMRRTTGINVFHIPERNVFRSWEDDGRPMPMITLVYPWDMERGNFRGYVSKKHGGPTSIIISPISQRIRNPDGVKSIKDGMVVKEVEHLTLGESCGCGSQIRVSDLKRGDTVCPICGNMNGSYKNLMQPEVSRKVFKPSHHYFQYSVDIATLEYEVSDEAWGWAL